MVKFIGNEDPFCRHFKGRTHQSSSAGQTSRAETRVYATVAPLKQEVFMSRWFLMVLTAFVMTGCGYNDFQRLDEQTKSAWSEVLNQYQRRADLVPNIVATVKGEAAFEQETLTKVIEARAKATSIQVSPETLNNPEAFQKFQAAQGELGSALSRLMVVAEQYPSLRANDGFRDLRVQLEGTENRVTVARNRYIQAVQEYNVLARSFPTNVTAMVFSYPPKPSFSVQNEAAISAPPVVDFDKK
jgi:LemA protein